MTTTQPWKFINQLFRSHPWHGVSIGKRMPESVSCYIEIVPTDTMKYELDKESGILRIDRPQKYSNYCPALYGFIPQTYCGQHIGNFCAEKTSRANLAGDGDPLDICVLTEKPILRSDILVTAIPIGGFRTIDNNQADDKIIAVLEGDFIYGKIRELDECPANLIDRLRHYFLTYKECPGETKKQRTEITHLYGQREAHRVIQLAYQDYQDSFWHTHSTFKSISLHSQQG